MSLVASTCLDSVGDHSRRGHHGVRRRWAAQASRAAYHAATTLRVVRADTASFGRGLRLTVVTDAEVERFRFVLRLLVGVTLTCLFLFE